MTGVEKKSSDELAVIRTLMAADRTLMAWFRTALSMISFGFTIYKLLQAFQEGGGVLRHDVSPRNISLFLIGLGTVSMVLGTIDYWGQLKDLGVTTRRMMRPSLAMSLLMSILGLILFSGIVVQLF